MRRSRQGGFSLLECVAALALMGFAMLVATSLLTVLAKSTTRTRVNLVMLHELESAAELVRAGLLPLRTGAVSFSTAADDCRSLVITAVVEGGDVPGLYQVTLRAECDLGLTQKTRYLETQVWQP